MFRVARRKIGHLCSGNNKDICATALTQSVPLATPRVGGRITQERSL